MNGPVTSEDLGPNGRERVATRPPRPAANHKKPLRFYSVAELVQTGQMAVDWIARGWLAAGAIYQLTGAPKVGKTSLLLHLVSCILRGRPFLGQPTQSGPVVYLSEQTQATLTPAVGRAGMGAEADLEMFVASRDLRILPWGETVGTPWPDVVEQAVAECRRIGARVLVIDTLHQFAGLRGDRENNSGDCLEALEPLQVAASEGLAVAIGWHDRKGGGEVGESGRGSSAVAGAVDVISALRRGEGQARPGVRVLHGLSRFDETPPRLVIERLADGSYSALGDEVAVAHAEARQALLAALPITEGDAITFAELYAAAGGARSTAQRVLKDLLGEGIALRSGTGRKNNPFRHWRRLQPCGSGLGLNEFDAQQEPGED